MIDIFFIFLLVHYGSVVIANKYNIRNKILSISDSLNSRFLYDLSECEFCTVHLLGLILLPFFIVSCEFKLLYLLLPLISTSAIFLIKRKL